MTHLDGVLLGVPRCPLTSDLQLLGGWRGQEGRSSQEEDDKEGGDEEKHRRDQTRKTLPWGKEKMLDSCSGNLSWLKQFVWLSCSWLFPRCDVLKDAPELQVKEISVSCCHFVSIRLYRGDGGWRSFFLPPLLCTPGISPPLERRQKHTFKPTLKFHVRSADSTLVTISRNGAISCLWACQCSVSANKPQWKK